LGSGCQEFKSLISDQFRASRELAYRADLKLADIVGSTPTLRTKLCGVGITVVFQPSKLAKRVRLPYPAPICPRSITESATGFYPVSCGFDSCRGRQIKWVVGVIVAQVPPKHLARERYLHNPPNNASVKGIGIPTTLRT
jgi:hypothetical protein